VRGDQRREIVAVHAHQIKSPDCTPLQGQLRRAHEIAGEVAPDAAQVDLVHLARQDLLAVEETHAHTDQDQVGHAQAGDHPPDDLVLAPEEHQALGLHQEGHRDDDKAGQQVGGAHAGGLA
jgi:hypothetical protein